MIFDGFDFRNTDTMDVVDGDWIRKRLDGRHGEKAELARAIGISAQKLSLILSGKRQVQAHEIPKVVDYFNNLDSNTHPTGFSEPARTFLTPVDPPATGFSESFSAGPGRASYRVNMSEPGFGILRGDIITLKLGAQAQEGALVVVTEADDYGSARSFIARKAGNLFIIGDPAEPAKRPTKGMSITVMGVISALHRDFSGATLT